MRRPIAYALVWASSMGAAYLAADNLRDYQREACHRGIRDRSIAQRESRASEIANRIVANDPDQPRVTRAARRYQADVNAAAVRDRAERLPPKLDCG